MPAFFESIKPGDKVKYFDPACIESISEDNICILNLVHTITRMPQGTPNANTIIELDGCMQTYAIGCIDPTTEFSFGESGLEIVGT